MIIALPTSSIFLVKMSKFSAEKKIPGEIFIGETEGGQMLTHPRWRRAVTGSNGKCVKACFDWELTTSIKGAMITRFFMELV